MDNLVNHIFYLKVWLLMIKEFFED